jgi:GntR family transcriptional regulator
LAGRRDSRPRHQQIAADLRAQIMSGNLPPGTQLPSTQQLVEQYAAANATIQRALGALKNEGFVSSRVGKGVYVRDRQPFVVRVAAYFAPAPRGYWYRMLDVAETTPPAEVAQALDLGDEGIAILRHRLLLHDGDPVELSWSYYPAVIAAGSPLAGRGKISGGAPQVLAALGYPQREFTDRLSARLPTTEELETLELPDGVPVIRQFRVIYSDNDRPVEASILIKGAHLYELLYREMIS